MACGRGGCAPSCCSPCCPPACCPDMAIGRLLEPLRKPIVIKTKVPCPQGQCCVFQLPPVNIVCEIPPPPRIKCPPKVCCIPVVCCEDEECCCPPPCCPQKRC